MFGRIQSGQILILTSFFLMAILVVFLGVFKAGWMTTEKTRLQVSADSAAYSAALMQARDLNFQAYMNRAMIANQVMIGQSVAMSSYMQVNQQMWYWFENIGEVAKYIPYVGPFIKKATGLAQGFFGSTNKFLQIALNKLVLITNLTIFSQSTAAKAWHAATIASTPILINELIKYNDPDVFMPLISQGEFALDLKNNFNYMSLAQIDKTERLRPGPDRIAADDFRQIIVTSTDNFTKRRSRTFWNLNVFLAKIKMVQRGGTEFGKQPGKRLPYYSWSAVDTVSLHMKPTCWPISCKWREVTPVSWGRQATWHKGTYRWPENNSNWNSNIGTNRKAWNMVKTRDKAKEGFMEGKGSSVRKVGHYKVQHNRINDGFGKLSSVVKPGMKDFYFIQTDKKFKPCGRNYVTKQSSQGCPIQIVLSKPVKLFEALESSNVVDKNTINLQAISAAAAVFEPNSDIWGRKDNKIELANLYHPYWQARLIELPNSGDRLKVQMMAGK